MKQGIDFTPDREGNLLWRQGKGGWKSLTPLNLPGDAGLLAAVKKRIVYVATIADLAGVSVEDTSSVVVRDTKRGGIFTHVDSGYTVDGGLVFAAPVGYWVRQVAGRDYFLRWWDNIDLTGATSMTTRLAGIINNLPDSARLFWPDTTTGYIQLGSQLAITKNISWESEGKRTKLQVNGVFSPAITFTGLSQMGVNKIEVYKTQNLTSTTLVFFDNCEDITFTRNVLHDGGGGVTFRKVKGAVVKYNTIYNTNLSGIRASKNGNTITDACSNFTIESNILTNNDYSGTGGNGGIFFGSDGGTSGHSNIKVLYNFLYQQGGMCIAMDGRGYDIEVGGNVMTQSATAEGVEPMAWGGGDGIDGMKRLNIHNNYIEQLNLTKAGGGCILLYSNVTDVDIIANHTKGGPQALYVHFKFDHSYIANVNVQGNVFENTPQGVLFYKNGTNVLTTPPANINIFNNTYTGITTLAEYSTVPTAEQMFRIFDNMVNGKKEVRGPNLESIYALPKSAFLGQYTTTGSLTTQYGGIYQVRPLSTGNPTKVILGASASLLTPTERMAGIEVEMSGVNYNTTKVSLTASNGAVRKTMATGRLDTGDVPILEMVGAWNDGLLKIGGVYMWANGATIRAKSSLPTSATDGTILFQ